MNSTVFTPDFDLSTPLPIKHKRALHTKRSLVDQMEWTDSYEADLEEAFTAVVDVFAKIGCPTNILKANLRVRGHEETNLGAMLIAYYYDGSSELCAMQSKGQLKHVSHLYSGNIGPLFDIFRKHPAKIAEARNVALEQVRSAS